MARFCGGDEEHDPSEEFEEYLACAVCGDNCKFLFPFVAWIYISQVDPQANQCHVPAAHRQCARDANSLGPEDGTLKSMTNTRQTPIDLDI